MLVFTSTSLVPCRPRLLNWGEGGLVHTVCVCASLVPRRPYTHQSDREGEKVNCPNRSNPYHKCDTDYCKSWWSKEGVAMMMSSQQQQQAGRVRVWECVHVDHCVLFCSPPLYLFLLIGDMWQEIVRCVHTTQYAWCAVHHFSTHPYFWTIRTNELVSWYPPPGGGES